MSTYMARIALRLGIMACIGCTLAVSCVQSTDLVGDGFIIGNPDDTSATGKYAVVDTSQNLCFDNQAGISCPASDEAFGGQDAQYDGHQPSYTLSDDELTVHDNVTGLTWMQDADIDGDGDIDADDKMTFDQAQAYPTTLNAINFGGFNDWRVPTIKELYSLIDFRGTDPTSDNTSTLIPFIDTDYFAFAFGDTTAGERVIDSQWVTSTLYVADNNMMFGVNFADGRIKGYGRVMPDPMASEKTFYVRLCRGNAAYGINSFVNNGDGTITDEATDLMWSQDDSGVGMTWDDALDWVQQRNAVNYLGHADWRLPNAKELQSIVDYTRSPDTTSSAAIDAMFNTTPIVNLAGQTDYPFFWTGTTHLSQNRSAARAVYVAFGRGMGSYDNVNLVDVHGAGCQRSDPKTGNAADYPQWGHGPQGDVQRVFNYVRLVRDAE